jgi:hypothetical protein
MIAPTQRRKADMEEQEQAEMLRGLVAALDEILGLDVDEED